MYIPKTNKKNINSYIATNNKKIGQGNKGQRLSYIQKKLIFLLLFILK